MPVSQEGAQRASGHKPFRLVVVAVMAAAMAIGGLASSPTSVAAAGKKVVIVVGPVGASTSNYIYNARKLAAQARSYGATVYEIYSPHATWARVKSVAQGANLFIYLGHGNGYPSPYGAFSKYSKDGLGLNSSDGSSHHTYYGEYYVQRYLRFAPNAVVILNRLCYASGNSEWGSANPTKSTAMKRVDYYAAGFLRTGARAVFAEGTGSAAYILYSLFKTNRTIKQTFWADPTRSTLYDFAFSSVRNAGKTAIMDPSSPGRYYRSVVGDIGMTAASWR
ncbi:MAG TPA: hypothetical protein VFY18_14440, partial [Candidatus Limnocylindrales bacterium]|nr:hypothetical protein [Candidatus Limnocylindrales bacterium]